MRQLPRRPRATVLGVLAVLALASALAAAGAVAVILSRSTNPMFSLRQNVTVPDLCGLTGEAAAAQPDAAQLSLVWDERYSQQEAGRVIAQRPAAGSTVKQGQRLTLTVSKGPNLVSVPDLKGQTRADALEALRAAGLCAAVDYIRNDPTLTADTVILQQPAAGERLEAGSAVTVTVARAVPDPYRQVPQLTGLTLAEARRRLAALELLPTLTPSDLTEGTVTAQEPIAGSLARRGTHVSLTVTP